MQRAGRATCGSGRIGEFIWFYPEWCKGERINVLATVRPSQLRKVMNINDEVDSETERDEEKREEKVKKKGSSTRRPCRSRERQWKIAYIA